MRQKEEIAKKLASSIQHIDISGSQLLNKEQYSFIISNSPGFIEHNGIKTPIIPKSKISLGFKKEALRLIQQCVDDILSIEHPKFGALYHYLDDEHVKEIIIDIIIEVEENEDPNKYNLIFQKIRDFFKNLDLYYYDTFIKIGNLKTMIFILSKFFLIIKKVGIKLLVMKKLNEMKTF